MTFWPKMAGENAGAPQEAPPAGSRTSRARGGTRGQRGTASSCGCVQGGLEMALGV